jgi:hypothetical protein
LSDSPLRSVLNTVFILAYLKLPSRDTVVFFAHSLQG